MIVLAAIILALAAWLIGYVAISLYRAAKTPRMATYVKPARDFRNWQREFERSVKP